MEIYNATAKTKSDELRVTRAIGALLITSSKKVEDLLNEKITIFIERANGSNVEIASNISLKHFILGATYGQSLIKSDTVGLVGCSALCEISLNGAILLEPNESIKIALTGLTSSATYTINGIEYPEEGESVLELERKTVLSDEVDRAFNVEGNDLILIGSASLLTEVQMTFANGVRSKYTVKEILALAFDLEGIIRADIDGTTSHDTGDVLMMPLDEVVLLEFEKGAGTMDITLMKF